MSFGRGAGPLPAPARRTGALPAPLRVRGAAASDHRPRARTRLGHAALAVMLATGLAIAAGAAARPSPLTPSSEGGFPGWFAGPLSGLWPGGLSADAFGVLFLLMAAAYLVALRVAGELEPRWALGTVAALHLVFALAPVLLTTDVFGYLAYARIGALEGLNPYAVGADALRGDPVHPFVVWHEDPSPYGPLFTVLSFALAPLGVPAGVWILKTVAAAAGLGVVALVHRAAVRLDAAPTPAALFVGLNPLVLVYVVGGAHNDALMVLLVMAGVVLALGRTGRRDRPARAWAAGVALAAAAGVKVVAVVLLPFLVLAAGRPGRVVAGALAGTVAVMLIALLAIGPGAAELGSALADQAAYVSTNSPQYLVGRALGLDGVTPGVRLGATVVLLAVLAVLLLRTLRGGDPLAAAGWAALATLATSVWLMPWYVMWVLPLAALARGRALRVAALVLCAGVIVTRIPLPVA